MGTVAGAVATAGSGWLEGLGAGWLGTRVIRVGDISKVAKGSERLVVTAGSRSGIVVAGIRLGTGNGFSAVEVEGRSGV